MKKLLNKKNIYIYILGLSLILISCGFITKDKKNKFTVNKNFLYFQSSSYTIKTDLTNLQITGFYKNNPEILISQPQNFKNTTYDNDKQQLLIKTNDNKQIILTISEFNGRLKFSLKTNTNFNFPIIQNNSVKQYIFPLAEGYFFQSDDKQAINFFKKYGNEGFLNYLPTLSFFQNSSSVNIFMAHSYYSKYFLFGNKNLSYKISHQTTPKIANKFNYDIFISLTKPEIKNSAKDFRDYLKEINNFKNINQKIINKPNLTKLKGALHIYLWDQYAVAEKDIVNLKKTLKLILTSNYGVSNLNKIPKELKQQLKQAGKEKWLSKYDKSIILNYFNYLFNNWQKFYQNNNSNLTDAEKVKNFKLFIASKFGLNKNIKNWGDLNSIFSLDNFKKSGIDNMIIGLDSYKSLITSYDAFQHAMKLGYLVSAYDSYNSIHQPNYIGWETADFGDNYQTGAIIKQNGEKDAGFLGKGSHFNSKFAEKFYKERTNYYYQNFQYNAWFLDTDATGEALYEDYNPQNPMTKQDDLVNRIKRLKGISSKHAVVGSEGAYYEFAKYLDYGEGGLTAFIWDYDIARNKKSIYYAGDYWPENQPPRYFKQLPLKPSLEFYFNPKYKIPFYSMVLGDSIIISDHWEWDSFKIKGIVKTRLLTSILYQQPALFHISKERWQKNKALILAYYKIYNITNKILFGKQMLNFSYLTNNKNLQQTKFIDGYKIIVNFAKQSLNNYDGLSAYFYKDDKLITKQTL